MNYIEIEPKGKIYYHGNGVNINFIYLHETGGLQGFMWGDFNDSIYLDHAERGGGADMKQFVDKDGKIAYSLNI